MTRALAPLMLLALVALAIWAAAQSMAAAPLLSDALDQANRDWQIELSDTAIGEWVDDGEGLGATVAAIENVPREIGTDLSHAYSTHDPMEVERVRKCINDKNGADHVWKEKEDGVWTYHLLCQEPDGTWADQIIRFIKGKWEEITAFEPRGGVQDYQRIKDWFGNKPTAHRVNSGSLPWNK